MQLAKLQNGFKNMMLDPESIKNDKDFQSEFLEGDISLENRFSIYQNNIILTLIGVIRDTFPILSKLVGDEFLTLMAKEFIKTNHPKTGNLNEYGAEFPSFIGEFELAKSMPYLPDIARFEWLKNESYYAKDDIPLAPEKLQTLSEDQLSNLIMQPRHAVKIATSPWPILAIRDFCETDNPNEQLSLNQGGINILIHRPYLNVLVTEISDELYKFIDGMQKNMPLQKINETILTASPNFNLGETLQTCFEYEIIRDI